MNILDMHSDNAKLNVETLGRPVILKDTEGNSYDPIYAMWNDVEHVLKTDGLDAANPMGARSSIYFDAETLYLAGLSPTKGWTITGSPNKYVAEKEYYLDLPKQDRQLPGKLFFLSEKKTEDTAWKGVR